MDRFQALLEQRGQQLVALRQALEALPVAQRQTYQAALAELSRQDGLLQERSRLIRDGLGGRLRHNGSRSSRSPQPVVTGVFDRQA